MKKHFNEIKNCIDEHGNLISAINDVNSSINACELLGESLLGAILNIRGKKFIIRMLEIYYGGVGDDAHDWYRSRFVYKKSGFKDHTEIQSHDGFRVYLSSLDTKNKYTRFDIVAGPKGVPISYLVRSVWDENFNIIGNKKGSPNIVLQAMGILSIDHGTLIEINNSEAKINIEDTHEEILRQRELTIKRSLRINLTSDFEKKNQVLWNLCLE